MTRKPEGVADSESAKAGHRPEMMTHIKDQQTAAAFFRHVADWKGCTACPLHQCRKRVVFYRGHLPCDVLFIGEAPGEVEDLKGYPFIGPAGKKLDTLLQTVWASLTTDAFSSGPDPYNESQPCQLIVGITNIVACIPTENAGPYSSPKIRAPTKAEAKACQNRLREIVDLAKPRLLVSLGDVARRFLSSLPAGKHLPQFNLSLIHPSHILRKQVEDPRAAALLEKRFIINLSEALEKL